jgi:UDP-N-acetylglucosamine 2-epimerase (non-hydrolysing)
MAAPTNLLNALTVEDPLTSEESGRKTVAIVFGTRPEAIKLAPVIAELRNKTGEFHTTVVNSGQHDSLLAPFLAPMGVKIDHDLRVMTRDQNPGSVCSHVMAGLGDVFSQKKPDLVVVQGDTTTALAGALFAYYLGIPVAHVEAGSRSFDDQSPFPEEMNRTLISRLATYHFAATVSNLKTLADEGVAPERIFVTGNPVVDSLVAHFNDGEPDHNLQAVLDSTSGCRRVILTTHRRESFGAALEKNLDALRRFVEDHNDVALIFPVHPNPSVVATAKKQLSDHPRIILINPLPYNQFICLLKAAWLIVSDSGGVQEEVPTLGKPLLILRKNTERPESIECGIAKLVGEQPGQLEVLLEDAYARGSWTEQVSCTRNPFGDGKSGARIATLICELIGALRPEAACISI